MNSSLWRHSGRDSAVPPCCQSQSSFGDGARLHCWMQNRRSLPPLSRLSTQFSIRQSLRSCFVCRAHGLTGLNWHRFRHVRATLFDPVGTPLGNVQALVGCASSESTRDTYIGSVPADARRAVEGGRKANWTQMDPSSGLAGVDWYCS